MTVSNTFHFQNTTQELLIGTPLFTCPGHYSSLFERSTENVMFPSKNDSNLWFRLKNKKLVTMDCLECE